MNTLRIRTGHAKGEIYLNVPGDFEWVRANRDELLETYGECVILVYEREVIGFGQTVREAEKDAEKRLPQDVQQVTPITAFLAYRDPFARVRLREQREA